MRLVTIWKPFLVHALRVWPKMAIFWVRVRLGAGFEKNAIFQEKNDISEASGYRVVKKASPTYV